MLTIAAGNCLELRLEAVMAFAPYIFLELVLCKNRYIVIKLPAASGWGIQKIIINYSSTVKTLWV
jgi:hypothetical protein